MSNTKYKLIKASLSQADDVLEVFRIGLSPTSLDSIANHIARHTLAMLDAKPEPVDLAAITIGLMLKLTCDKEARAFLKAEEAADAVKED